MNTTEEQENIMRELRHFEIATNSKISEEKTNLYHYSTKALPNNLPFEQLFIQTQVEDNFEQDVVEKLHVAASKMLDCIKEVPNQNGFQLCVPLKDEDELDMMTIKTIRNFLLYKPEQDCIMI